MSSSALTLASPPPFLLGAGLLLWGWQCGFLPYAILMALVLEFSRFSRWRIPITEKEFNHISDLSAIILFAVVLYLFTVNTYFGIYTILAILPFLFFLLISAQLYSMRGKIRLSALFISLRRSPATMPEGDTEVDLSFPYLLISVISASAGNHHEIYFYFFVVCLFAWSLWRMRPHYAGFMTWALLFTIAALAGYAGQSGIHRFQGVIEEVILDWFDMFTWRSRDPTRNTTAIGSVARLKLSDRIMVRLDTHGEKIADRILLREATYTDYGYGVWTNFRNTLQLVDPETGGTTWIINRSNAGTRRFTISYHMEANRSIIPVPLGINAITGIRATGIDASAFGSIMMELHPGWARYDVLFTDKEIYDVAPLKEDLAVPPPYRDDLARLARKLDLIGRPPEQALSGIRDFFAENFSYSLTQRERYPRGRYLAKFLFDTRRGHCEYFATATVLLLRAAGIPARYAVGYSVDEYSRLEGRYLARANHAHSWAMAYINDAWRVVDTTPPVWAAVDGGHKSVLQPLVDLWSWFAYTLATGIVTDSEDGAHVLPWVAFPLLLYAVWRFFIKHRLRRHAGGRLPENFSLKKRGTLPSFQELLSRLEQKYRPRDPSEPLGAWIAGIEELSGLDGLGPLLALHYRHRFDPVGLRNDEKSSFDEMVRLKIKELG